ncbi:MAG: Uncharacterized protein G01um101433_623 [Parcubacteria group bacterium Gr01-1014_33]|nr:MAG: Uncharacterized protein G01um101433_623 [Parcubacteria group bacterium Gr01-1014_33]
MRANNITLDSGIKVILNSTYSNVLKNIGIEDIDIYASGGYTIGMTKKTDRARYYRLQRLVRGFSNHRRIEILELLSGKPELSVREVSEELDINFKTASEHIRRLAIVGLVHKRAENTNVRHKLTVVGIVILKFLRTLE